MKVESLKTKLNEYDRLVQIVCTSNPVLALCPTQRGEKRAPSFSHRVDSFEATAQNNSGRCWIFSACNLLRIEMKKEIPNLPKTFELSQNFVFFFDKLEKANLFLQNILETADGQLDDRTVAHLLADPIPDGGNWRMFANIVEKYGIVSKNAYGETFMSDNTCILNEELKKLLVSSAQKIRNASDTKQKDTIINACMQGVRKLLVLSFGEPPTSFRLCYQVEEKKPEICSRKIWTPRSFASKYVKLNNFVTFVHDPRNKRNCHYFVERLGNVYGQKSSFFNVDIETLQDLTVHAIKSKTGVWFGADASRHVNRVDGVFDEKQFNDVELFDVTHKKSDFLTKECRLLYRLSEANHAMLFTGVNFDEENLINKFQIENSWGKGNGQAGYYSCTPQWFKDNVFQIAVPKSIVPNPLLAKMKNKTCMRMLPIWDPIGCLAD